MFHVNGLKSAFEHFQCKFDVCSACTKTNFKDYIILYYHLKYLCQSFICYNLGTLGKTLILLKITLDDID